MQLTQALRGLSLRWNRGNFAERIEPATPAPQGSAAAADIHLFDGGPASDIAFLAGCGVSDALLNAAAERARSRSTAARDELFALGFPRDRYWLLLAEALGLGFVDDFADATLVSNAGMLATEAVRRANSVLVRIGGRVILVLAPRRAELAALRRRLRVMPALAERTRIAAPEAIRAFIVARRHKVLAHYAVNRLARVMPGLSASRHVATGASGPVALLAAALAIALVAPTAATTAFGLLFTLFFLNCSLWKLRAAFHRRRTLRLEPVWPDSLPTYSVLVPLYREAEVVADLVAHLRGLDYPALCIKRTTLASRIVNG